MHYFEGNLNSKVHERAQPSSSNNRTSNDDEPYSYDFKTLIQCHPLFLMAVHNRYKLMGHPLSKSLVMRKFAVFNLVFFILLFLIYAVFLGAYTTIVLRTKHPQYYYDLTGLNFSVDVCQNVITTLGNRDATETVDDVLRIIMYVGLILVGIKDLWYIVVFVRIQWTKALTFLPELVTIGCGSYFIYNYHYQTKHTMRCPSQWDVGAYGLFTGYMALFYYIQYIPILGTYVIMMRQILIRFLLFLPVLMVLILGFALALYMTFPNFDSFDNMGISLAKTGNKGALSLFSF